MGKQRIQEILLRNTNQKFSDFFFSPSKLKISKPIAAGWKEGERLGGGGGEEGEADNMPKANSQLITEEEVWGVRKEGAAWNKQ